MQRYNIIKPIDWEHHRYGWNFLMNEFKNRLHDISAINFYTNGTFNKFISNYNQFEDKPWLAFFHITPSDKNIENHLVNNQMFKQNLKTCYGIFTLSENSACFLKKYIKNDLVHHIKYPMPPQFAPFCFKDFSENPRKSLYFVGHWLRNYQPFLDLNTKFEKVLVRCPDTPQKWGGISFLQNSDYDAIFKKNIVFLNLIDSSANTVILECIANNTPLIINRLPAIEEYFGKDYCLFYETIDEASEIITEKNIEKAHNYIKNMCKKDFLISSFIDFFSSFKIKKMQSIL